METLLCEIKSNDGVVGSVILGRDGRNVTRDLPSVFRDEKLHSFANHIRRLALLGKEDGGFHGMEFSYAEAIVVARFIDDNNHLLLTFCSPGVDVQMIHLQHNVLLPEFQERLVASPQQAETIASSPMENMEQGTKRPPLLYRGVAYEE